jgi:hypothetical protein
MQRITTAPECISDLVLDAWYAEELTPSELQRVQAHVASCATCAERQRSMFAEHQRFLETAPDLSAQAKLVARTKRRSSLRRALPVVASIVALAASVMLMVWKPNEPTTQQTRTKGESHLGVYIKRGDRVLRGNGRDTVQPGDLLRFTYSTPHPGYLTILGLDEHAATRYFPAEPNAAPIGAGMDMPLDFAVQLDEQLGTETIHALWCPASYAIEPIRKALAERRELARPSEACTVSVLSLRKVARP